jgi:hypothetical protein
VEAGSGARWSSWLSLLVVVGVGRWVLVVGWWGGVVVGGGWFRCKVVVVVVVVGGGGCWEVVGVLIVRLAVIVVHGVASVVCGGVADVAAASAVDLERCRCCSVCIVLWVLSAVVGVVQCVCVCVCVCGCVIVSCVWWVWGCV